ncbi:Gfo/Idh/MocA family protein [Holdemania massiliensis]|uniref:Gfo/Idh/MocA family protein n=1 Tax=Holdemania massiliensis TaxID=1468449 RepID=UPI001F05D8CB|nr:Gfo/Idh/MocA family oxidoreductase [Holdemania massiliensis]MCH1939719.1 Gfo/Idh/MocA family oxidoreductase [Holdemania massiliensis]
MKLGILGTGMIVKALMKTIKDLPFEKVIILGTKETEEETQRLCHENHLTDYVLDYEELLKSDVDTVYVALPNHLHAAFAKKALERDKHVIIEKPITANTSQLKELIEIAEQHHKMIFEAMNIHYLPAYAALQSSIQKIGKPKIINFNYSQYSSRYDAFQRGEVLAAFDPQRAGGAAMDLNVYNLHAVVGLFGKPKAVQYFANLERNIDTSGVLILDYGDFKVSAIGAKDCKAPVRSTIQGTQGCIVIPKAVNQMDSWQLLKNNGEQEEFCDQSGRHRLYHEFMEFDRMLKQQDWPCQNKMLEISLAVSEILEQARRQNGIDVHFNKEDKA